MATGQGCSASANEIQKADGLVEQARKHLLFYGRDFSDVIIARASGAMCATIGHNHPVIRDALRKSADEVIHLDSTKLAPVVISLAVELCEMLPPQLQKAMFLNTGS